MARSIKLRLETILDDSRVTGVTSDSKEVRPGMIFAAVEGTKTDGHQFIQEALDAGAVFAVGEKKAVGPADRYLQVEDSRDALAFLSASFFKNPSHEMILIGVTGTSGKTTTTYLLESIF